MNEIINKESYFYKILAILKQNYKILIFSVILVLVFLGTLQFYFLYQNNHILKTSIKYNSAKSSSSIDNRIEIFNQLSLEKNFYGVLATLEKIQIKLKSNDINSANEDYLNLLKRKNFSKLYKATIALHGSYSFLNQLKNIDNLTSINSENYKNIKEKINIFLTFIDPSLESYNGFKLEILYLLSIAEQDKNNETEFNNETKNIYKAIQENDKISSSLKERVKKIHEFQKNK